MKEREDLLKTKALCERILAANPANKMMQEKLETVKKKIRLIERRLTDVQEVKHALPKKKNYKTEYL